MCQIGAGKCAQFDLTTASIKNHSVYIFEHSREACQKTRVTLTLQSCQKFNVGRCEVTFFVTSEVMRVSLDGQMPADSFNIYNVNKYVI